MRKNIVAGNWKMNTTVPEGVQLANDVCAAVAAEANLKCEVIVGVPFTHLTAVRQAIGDANVGLSAQNCADHTSGAYTGEVSAEILASCEIDYCIVGHSERRQYYGETDKSVAEKVNLLLGHGLKPIVCVGEVLQEREENRQFDVVKTQVEGGLFHLTEEQMREVVIAYEPVWAIGTGKTATPEQAQEMHAHIRSLLAAKYGKTLADDISILYGGSCKPSNAKELFACPDIDGGLIGGASLKADDFMGIITAF